MDRWFFVIKSFSFRSLTHHGISGRLADIQAFEGGQSRKNSIATQHSSMLDYWHSLAVETIDSFLLGWICVNLINFFQALLRYRQVLVIFIHFYTYVKWPLWVSDTATSFRLKLILFNPLPLGYLLLVFRHYHFCQNVDVRSSLRMLLIEITLTIIIPIYENALNK